MMQSIEPVWDGNETWLVMGGLLLYVGFPPGYYILMPAFYLPVMLMLFALIFRGIAFTFRFQTAGHRRVWDWAFALGSLSAAFAQGLILGGVVQGVPVVAGAFAGGPFTFLNVEGILCGLGLVAGYALLGAGWLIWKTNGATQTFGREAGRAALLVTAVMMAAVSFWTAFAHGDVAAALVRLAEHRVPGARAAARGLRDRRAVAEPLGRARCAALPARDGALSPRLRRPRGEPLALCRAPASGDLGRGLRSVDAALRRHRPRHHHAHRARYQAHAYWVFRGKTLPEADNAYGPGDA